MRNQSYQNKQQSKTFPHHPSTFKQQLKKKTMKKCEKMIFVYPLKQVCILQRICLKLQFRVVHSNWELLPFKKYQSHQLQTKFNGFNIKSNVIDFFSGAVGCLRSTNNQQCPFSPISLTGIFGTVFEAGVQLVSYLITTKFYCTASRILVILYSLK